MKRACTRANRSCEVSSTWCSLCSAMTRLPPSKVTSSRLRDGGRQNTPIRWRPLKVVRVSLRTSGLGLSYWLACCGRSQRFPGYRDQVSVRPSRPGCPEPPEPPRTPSTRRATTDHAAKTSATTGPGTLGGLTTPAYAGPPTRASGPPAALRTVRSARPTVSVRRAIPLSAYRRRPNANPEARMHVAHRQ